MEVEEASEADEVDGGAGRGTADTPPLINGDTEFRDGKEEVGDTLPTDMSDTFDSEPEKYNNKGEDGKCTAPHEGKLLLQDEFPFTIDQLFTMIFTNSKFNMELREARGATNYVQVEPWQPQNGLKCRQVKYTINVSAGPMGPKDVQVTETQVINKCSRPGVVYSIDCTSDNAGIPYADYFSVQAHYCLERRAAGASLALYGSVHYKKSMWPLVKGFLEKNAISGLEDFGRVLMSKLRAAARPAPDTAAREHPRLQRHRDVSLLSAPPTVPAEDAHTSLLAESPRAVRAADDAGRSAWLLLALGALLLLNVLLYWRLNRADHALELEHLHTRISTLTEAQAAEWARVLEHHSHRQRDQMLAWRDALDCTVRHLVQTEKALTKLLETIKPALESRAGDARGSVKAIGG